jgi:transposase
MYIESVPNRGSRPAILLRESYREGGKVRKRTVANLSSWPADRVEALRAALRGGKVLQGELGDAFEITRSRPHGHVAATLGTLRELGLHEAIDPKSSRMRDLVVAMIVARIIEPQSKLATARGLAEATLSSTLGEELNLTGVSEDHLYDALDWLFERQPCIEKQLAKRHLQDGSFVLYDVSSTYFEGHKCPIAKRGYSRDGKSDKLQVTFGLLCDADGCPVAVEVFDGNTGDPKTVGPQISKLRERFGLRQIVVVGDRGMLTSARLKADVRPAEDYSWITALRAPAIRALAEEGVLQLSLFDESDLAEVTSDSFPGERLIVCRNPLLADQRARKRNELLSATEAELEKVVAATKREKRPLHTAAAIGLRVGRVLGRYKMSKHFKIDIRDTGFSYERDEASIREEAALDGIYVVRTNVPEQVLESDEVVAAYKDLANVERAFRSFKTVDLNVRPIHHRLENRVRAHIFLCMLAYYVEWHMRRKLAPILFDDESKEEGQALRSSIVAPARRSPKANAKAASRRTQDDLPVHSFQTLLRDLSTVTRNRIQPKLSGLSPFDQVTRPTPVQSRAFELLSVRCV